MSKLNDPALRFVPQSPKNSPNRPYSALSQNAAGQKPLGRPYSARAYQPSSGVVSTVSTSRQPKLSAQPNNSMQYPPSLPMTAHPQAVLSAYENLVQKEIYRRGTAINVDKYQAMADEIYALRKERKQLQDYLRTEKTRNVRNEERIASLGKELQMLSRYPLVVGTAGSQSPDYCALKQKETQPSAQFVRALKQKIRELMETNQQLVDAMQRVRESTKVVRMAELERSFKIYYERFNYLRAQNYEIQIQLVEVMQENEFLKQRLQYYERNFEQLDVNHQLLAEADQVMQYQKAQEDDEFEENEDDQMYEVMIPVQAEKTGTYNAENIQIHEQAYLEAKDSIQAKNDSKAQEKSQVLTDSWSVYQMRDSYKTSDSYQAKDQTVEADKDSSTLVYKNMAILPTTPPLDVAKKEETPAETNLLRHSTKEFATYNSFYRPQLTAPLLTAPLAANYFKRESSFRETGFVGHLVENQYSEIDAVSQGDVMQLAEYSQVQASTADLFSSTKKTAINEAAGGPDDFDRDSKDNQLHGIHDEDNNVFAGVPNMVKRPAASAQAEAREDLTGSAKKSSKDSTTASLTRHSQDDELSISKDLPNMQAVEQVSVTDVMPGNTQTIITDAKYASSVPSVDVTSGMFDAPQNNDVPSIEISSRMFNCEPDRSPSLQPAAPDRIHDDVPSLSVNSQMFGDKSPNAQLFPVVADDVPSLNVNSQMFSNQNSPKRRSNPSSERACLNMRETIQQEFEGLFE